MVAVTKAYFYHREELQDHFSGKIPAKHNLCDILSLPLEGTASSDDPAKSVVQQTQVKSKRGNPARSVLETHGINFPNPSYVSLSSAQSTSQSTESSLLDRCKPFTKVEEQAQLDIALRQSALETNTSLQSHHESLAPTGYPYSWPLTQTPFLYYPLFSNGPFDHYLVNINNQPFQLSHETVPNTCSTTDASFTQIRNNLNERPQQDLEITDAAMQLISLSSRQSVENE